MEREDYQVLTIKYSGMRNRFVRGRKLGWVMLGLLLLLAWGCTFQMAELIVAESWKILCKGYGIVTVVIAAFTNVKLILSQKLHYTELDMAIYSVANIGLIMLGMEIFCVGLMADEAVKPAVLFLVVSVILCVGFWSAVQKQNYKKLQEGAFRGKSYIMKLPKNVWIWYVTALPIIPLLSLIGRKIWFVSLNESLRVLILMYALLWLWMVLIYSLFVQAVMFIKLEYKMRRKERNDSKKENISNE